MRDIEKGGLGPWLSKPMDTTSCFVNGEEQMNSLKGRYGPILRVLSYLFYLEDGGSRFLQKFVPFY